MGGGGGGGELWLEGANAPLPLSETLLHVAIGSIYSFSYTHTPTHTPHTPAVSWCTWWGGWEDERCLSCFPAVESVLWPVAESQSLGKSDIHDYTNIRIHINVYSSTFKYFMSFDIAIRS